MKKNIKPKFKIPIQQELAYEIISRSLIVIFLGLTVLTATNFARFNWYTVIFFIITIVMIYLYSTNELLIKQDDLLVTYYKIHKPIHINIQSISDIIFHKHKRQVNIKTVSGEVHPVYIGLKNKKKLLNYLVLHHPGINCIVNTK